MQTARAGFRKQTYWNVCSGHYHTAALKEFSEPQKGETIVFIASLIKTKKKQVILLQGITRNAWYI